MAHKRHSFGTPQTHASHMSPRFDRLIGIQLQQWEHVKTARTKASMPIGDTLVHRIVECPSLGIIFDNHATTRHRRGIYHLLARHHRRTLASGS